MNYKDINTYDFHLDESKIAQKPIINRDESKLLVLNKKTGKFYDEVFKNIINYLNKGDVLVLNDTKVIPSRIYGYKELTNAKIEILLLKDLGDDTWECLVKPQKRLHVKDIIIFKDNFKCEVEELFNDGITHVKFKYNGIFLELLNEIGVMPLPPYIHEKLLDNNRYNTIYARNLGSAAAPTAGLHFTEELLNKLKEKEVKILFVTLDVGLGTFRPVIEQNITNHNMHKEFYSISKEVADELNLAKKEKRRIICVGTTSLRALESNIVKYGCFKQTKEETDIFIYPPYKFKSCDALITNFHLPKSTLIMLVCSFSSIDNIMNAYKHAIKNDYKFFSFGDAMFITDKEIE